jgi:hypothetical protein
MATRKGPAKGRDTTPPGGDVDLSTHPLVAERNVDPSEIGPEPPQLSALVGYVGPSRRDGSIRLYRDLSFRNYYEIPAEAVVSTTPINPDDENSPTRVQVAPDTKVEVVNVSVQSVEARYLSGSIAGGFYGAAAGGVGAAQAPAALCTNITTYMPSCVAQQQPPCTNITTHMPSCVGGGQQGVPEGCTIVMTTMACTFGGAETGTVLGPGGFCTNITTHMPSCVVQCNPNCIATVVTSGVRGGGQVCIDLYTANPSYCAQQCDPRCIATVVTSHDPAAFAARAVQPTPPQYCLTVVTANPTDCGQVCITRHTAIPSNCEPPICLTVVTANPTDCGPCLTVVTANPTDCGPKTVVEAAAFQAGAAANLAPQPTPPQYCITLYTANPTHCGPVFCATYYTARPTNCGPVLCATITVQTRGPICHLGGYPTRIVCNTNYPSCLQEVTATIVNDPGPLARGAAAQPQAAQQPCITLHTAYPSWCPPICPTVYTARPTGCG